MGLIAASIIRAIVLGCSMEAKELKEGSET
jgi:hypothetical protein